MSGSGYPPKGPRSGTNKGFPRPRYQTWGPGQHIYPHAHSNPHTPMTLQTVFYPQHAKPDCTNCTEGGNIYPANCAPDSPPLSDVSRQGSPRGSPRFFNPRCIPAPGFDLMPEGDISAMSSPGDDSHTGSCYFDLGQRAEISMDSGHGQGVASPFPLGIPQICDVRSQYSLQVRSRQGSASISSPQQVKNDEAASPRRGQKQVRNQKRNPMGQQKPDFYTISAAESSEGILEDDDEEEPEMQTTLNARIQQSICKQVDETLRNCLFWWLVNYKFSIPRNPKARDIETADDRDYEGFCSVVNDLTAKRLVPRDAVHHERIAELNTVLAGPSEIRHMLAHPERHLKSDWRMLGLIAAAIEVCKILRYKKGHRQLFHLYQSTQEKISALKPEKLGQAVAEISIPGGVDKKLK